MAYRIVGDSCTDLTPEMRGNSNIKIAPLSVLIGNHTVIDDETFDQLDFLARVKDFPECPKSACPSPKAYMDLFEGADEIYVVTLSGRLSGSYNSAELAKNQYLEEHPRTKILIIDSRSASIGQTLIVKKILESIEKGLSFEEVGKKAEYFRDEMETRFVLESLETLRKNGRLSNIKAIICSALNIKPIMMATDKGEIDKVSQARGINKALIKMTEVVAQDVVNAKEKILGIAHCNNYERALFVKEQMQKRTTFKEVVVVDMRAISSLYANDGGIIVCY